MQTKMSEKQFMFGRDNDSLLKSCHIINYDHVKEFLKNQSIVTKSVTIPEEA